MNEEKFCVLDDIYCIKELARLLELKGYTKHEISAAIHEISEALCSAKDEAKRVGDE